MLHETAQQDVIHAKKEEERRLLQQPFRPFLSQKEEEEVVVVVLKGQLFHFANLARKIFTDFFLRDGRETFVSFLPSDPLSPPLPFFNLQRLLSFFSSPPSSSPDLWRLLPLPPPPPPTHPHNDHRPKRASSRGMSAVGCTPKCKKKPDFAH